MMTTALRGEERDHHSPLGWVAAMACGRHCGSHPTPACTPRQRRAGRQAEHAPQKSEVEADARAKGVGGRQLAPEGRLPLLEQQVAGARLSLHAGTGWAHEAKRRSTGMPARWRLRYPQRLSGRARWSRRTHSLHAGLPPRRVHETAVADALVGRLGRQRAAGDAGGFDTSAAADSWRRALRGRPATARWWLHRRRCGHGRSCCPRGRRRLRLHLLVRHRSGTRG